jgi:hypothetical protein
MTGQGEDGRGRAGWGSTRAEPRRAAHRPRRALEASIDAIRHRGREMLVVSEPRRV